MPMIGTDYSAHRRSVDDLEQDYETAARRSKEREQTRDAKLEKNLETIIRKKDSELENTVKNVRDEYASSMKDQSKADRIERERLKQTLYDRNGRQAAATEEAATVDRDRAIEASKVIEAHASKALSDAERYREEQATASAERESKEREALAESYRKLVREAQNGDTEGERENLRDYRKKLNEESQSTIQQVRDELAAERRQSRAQAEQSRIVLQSQGKKADELLSNRLREKNLSMKAELGKHAESERASRELEIQPLREQVMATTTLQRDAARAKNEARANVIQELESDWNAKYVNQSLSHDLEKGKMKADQAETDRLHNGKMAAFVMDNETKTAKKISQQTAENYEQIKASKQAYDRSLRSLTNQAEHDQKLSTQALIRERENASERQNRALETQASTYQETISNQRKSQRGEVENLERILNVKNTTDDAGEISAGAEKTVRAAVTRQYDKVFQAEAERNARDREHLDENYHARISDVVKDKNTGLTEMNRQNLREQTLMRNEFVQHVDDVEENKRQMLNLASDANAKMTETTQKNSQRGMSDMRRHYEDIISSRDTEAALRFEEFRSQSEFEKRSMRREFQSQNADLIRKYEKKLTEQKSLSDAELLETRRKLDKITRDDDKRLNQALNDQARGYERRLADLEAQSKDRERQANQQHEDELEKVRKSNALLLSKKG